MPLPLWCEQKCIWLHLKVGRNIIAQSVSFSNAKWTMHLKPDNHLNRTACAYLWLPHTCAIHPAIPGNALVQWGVCQGVGCSILGSVSQEGPNQPCELCLGFLIHKMGTMICLCLCTAPGYMWMQSGRTQWEASRTVLECHMASHVASIQS